MFNEIGAILTRHGFKKYALVIDHVQRRIEIILDGNFIENLSHEIKQELVPGYQLIVEFIQ